MKIIKQIYFEDFTSLACEISDNFDMVKDEFGDIAIIAKYEEAKEIIEELVHIGHSLVSIRMSRPEWDGYCDEYIISLNHDGIWCEPMKRNGKYISDESTMIYIFDNCSSAVIPQCRGNILIEVGIEDEEEFDCDECCDCGGCDGHCKMCNEECSENASYLCPSDCDHKQCSGCPYIPSDSNTSVSTYGISEYYINGKPVDKETFVEYQADYDKYFQSAMSEMSKFLKLLNL